MRGKGHRRLRSMFVSNFPIIFSTLNLVTQMSELMNELNLVVCCFFYKVSATWQHRRFALFISLLLWVLLEPYPVYVHETL